jgi:hypothetical protein
MGSFNDWRGAANTPGLLDSLKAFGLKDGQVNPGSELPEDEDELRSLAVDAIHSDEARFTLDADPNSGGTFYAYGFGGLFWWTDGDDTIYGPFPCLEDAVATLIGMAEPNWYCSASGDISDEYLVAQCDGLVETGRTFDINGKPYVQTAEGLVRQ